MGIIFGHTGTAEPAYTVLHSYSTPIKFEVRRNPSYFIAEVPMEGNNRENNSFSILAKYIGVFGKPENEGAQSLSMTSPVLLEKEKSLAKQENVSAAVTAPVAAQIQRDNKMAFVLPFHFKSLSEVPKPTDSRVVLSEVPSKIVAVLKYSGWYSSPESMRYKRELVSALKRTGLIEEAVDEADVKWEVAQYHPPFTLPFLRRNEIWVELDKEPPSEEPTAART